jgi:hypothetical protein
MSKFGDTIIARFQPKRTETLRECMLPYIGQVFEFQHVWTAEEGETYAGQGCWVMSPKYNDDLPRGVVGLWIPREDLEELDHYDQFVWAKEQGLVRDFKVKTDGSVEVEYFPPLERIKIKDADIEKLTEEMERILKTPAGERLP